MRSGLSVAYAKARSPSRADGAAPRHAKAERAITHSTASMRAMA
jgi:hypothetical protein